MDDATRTAALRAATDPSCLSYNAFRRSCPSHRVLETLSGKWTWLIVVALVQGRLRNAELQRRVEGISPKMLAQSLRELERDGLILREVFAEVPPRVEYELTALGMELAGLMDHIRRWAEAHVPQIEAARAEAAAKSGASP